MSERRSVTFRHPAPPFRRIVQRVDIAVTCNWFAIALRCKIRGHDWRITRPTRCVSLTSCACCGRLLGARLTDATNCRWYRRSPQEAATEAATAPRSDEQAEVAPESGGDAAGAGEAIL
jgi:hypothetical protein